MKVPEFFHNVYYLSKEELISFEKFLITPYFNIMDSQNMVFKIIKKHLFYIKNEKYEELKDVIIKASNYSETTVRKILSNLNDNYIEFTKIQSGQEDPFIIEYNYCNYLMKKGNYELLDSRIEELDNSLKDLNNYDNDYFLKMFEKDILRYDILCTSEDNFNSRSKLNKQKHYTLESSKNLMVFTITKITTNLVNYVLQSTDIEEYNHGIFPIDLDNLFRFMGTPKYQMFNKHQKNSIKLYYKLYILFSNPLIDAHYYDYKDYYNRIKQEYNQDFRKTHHNILMNYCIFRRRVSDKDKIFTKESLTNLYEYIKNKYYVNQKTEYLHPINYRNFVIHCLNAGNKNMLIKFIEKHTDKLHPKEIELMKIYGMAHYYYLNGKYGLTVVNAELINNPKSFYKYDIINLLIKANYELENFERIRELLHNYKTYINKDTLLTNTDIEWYSKFVEYMNKFLSEKEKYFKMKKTINFEHLLYKIENETDFSTKNWLTDKLKTVISSNNKIQPKE